MAHNGLAIAADLGIARPVGDPCVIAMDDREYWTKRLREAEAQLDAATRSSEVKAAAKRLMIARGELARLTASSVPDVQDFRSTNAAAGAPKPRS